jgi:hypothetical protein
MKEYYPQISQRDHHADAQDAADAVAQVPEAGTTVVTGDS